MAQVTWACQVEDGEALKGLDSVQALITARNSAAEASKVLSSVLERYVFLPAEQLRDATAAAPSVAPAPWVVAAVTVGALDPSATSRIPEYPMRQVVKRMLADVEKFTSAIDDDEDVMVARKAFARSLVVAVAINAFGYENDVVRAKALAPLLRDGSEDVPARNQRVQDTLLEHQFLPRRQPTIDHVEIRSIEEFDTLLAVLHRSRAFSEKKQQMTLCVNASIFCSAGDASVAPLPLTAVNYWHLLRTQVDTFATSVREAAKSGFDASGMIQGGCNFNPFGAPHYIVGGHVCVTDASSRAVARQFISRFEVVLKDIRGLLAPPPQRFGAAKRTAAAVNPADLAADLHGGAGSVYQAQPPSYFAELQAEKLRLTQSIADANAMLFRLASTMHVVDRLELARVEAESQAMEAEQAGSTFDLLAQRVSAEQAEQRRIETQLHAEQQRLEKMEAAARHSETELQKAHAGLKHFVDLKQSAKEQMAAVEARLIKAQEAAERARDAADKVARRAQSRHEEELNRLMEARTSAIEEANATIVRQQQQSEAAVRAYDGQMAKSETAIRERTALAITNRREYSAKLTELQSKLASKLEGTRADERRGMLASAQLDQIKRRHGDKANMESVRGLQLTEATLASELDKLKQQKGVLEQQLLPARSSAQEAEAAAMAAEAEWRGAETAYWMEKEESWKEGLFELLETERHHRNEVESRWDAATTEILIAERLHWDRALAATQVALHDDGHGQARAAMAETKTRINMMNERILVHRSKLETLEYRIAKAAKEHQLMAGEYHRHHEAVLAEERSLEAARQTAFEAQANMKQLDAEANAFRQKCDLVRQALSRAPVDPLAAVRPVVLPPVGEIARRLRRLLRDATQRTHDANAEALHLERTLRRIGRECEERNEIRSRVRHAVTQYETRAEELETLNLKTQQGLQSRALRDKALREQLQSEYEAAQELTQRHRFEGQQRLREAYAAVDELTGIVQKSTSEIQAMRNQLAFEIKRNTPSNEELLRMELFHEFERQKELEYLVLAAHASRPIDGENIPAPAATSMATAATPRSQSSAAPSVPLSPVAPPPSAPQRHTSAAVTPAASTVARSPSVLSLESPPPEAVNPIPAATAAAAEVPS